jgi:hypothetical protein
LGSLIYVYIYILTCVCIYILRFTIGGMDSDISAPQMMRMFLVSMRDVTTFCKGLTTKIRSSLVSGHFFHFFH